MDVVNLADKVRQFTEAWSPKIVGDVNDMQVKVVKLRGEFVWHHHDVEDEMLLIVAGPRLASSSSFLAAPSTVPSPSPTKSTSCCWNPRGR